MSRLETSSEKVLDDLDHALIISLCAPQLFGRLETNDLNKLLQILFRRIIIDMQGKVVDFDLMYLSYLK